MDFLTVLLIAVGLAMDAFAVALGVGAVLQHSPFRSTFRLAFHFGLFQFMMPILGWLGGITVVQYVDAYDHWIAFALLAFIGTRMIHAAFGQSDMAKTGDPTRGLSLVMLSVATSMDALAVGLSLGVLRIGILYPSVIIGLVAAMLTTVGMQAGARLAGALGKRMEFVGGLVLIGVAVKIVMTHTG